MVTASDERDNSKEGSILYSMLHLTQCLGGRLEVVLVNNDDFEGLYRLVTDGFDDNFKRKKLLEKPEVITGENNLNKLIEYQEVRKAVEQAKLNKAVGIDMISNEVLKNNTVIDLLFNLFNMCMKNRLIPNEWRKSIIHPIPKEKKVSMDPLKYRGLALQSCIYKILCYVLNERVMKHLDEKLDDVQNGFRKGKSCLHHLYCLNVLLKNRIVNQESTFATFVDFRKAFDVVDRDLLFYRLRQYGVTGSILELIKQMYTNTLSYVRLNGLMSDAINSNNGVLQRNNLSNIIWVVHR